jgi:hypothetical protein
MMVRIGSEWRIADGEDEENGGLRRPECENAALLRRNQSINESSLTDHCPPPAAHSCLTYASTRDTRSTSGILRRFLIT